MLVHYTCHDCGNDFEVDVTNEWGTYEFVRCPACESGRTTLTA